MTTVPVNQSRQLKWKQLDGTLKPISELTTEELAKYRKVCAKKIEDYHRNYEFFRDMLEEMDNQLKQKADYLEKELARLKKIEEEV